LVKNNLSVVFVVGVALLLLIAAVIVVIETGRSGSETPGSAVTAGIDSSAVEEHQTSGAEEAPLMATLLEIEANTECPTVIFDSDSSEIASQYIQDNPQTGNTEEMWTDAVDKGAYPSRGFNITMSLQTSLPEGVTVHDLRAEIVAETDPIQGGTDMKLAICAANGHEMMALILNAPEQGPFLYEDEFALVPTDIEYFDQQTILVSPAEKSTVRLEVLLDDAYPAGTYEFNLVLDYEVDGRKESVTVASDNGPFRIATSECPTARSVDPVAEGDYPLEYEVTENPC
jgi:hypothetical protein